LAAAVISRNWQRSMTRRLLDLICFVVLCIVLTLGLWPFHAPENEVTWLDNRSGLRFGRFGTVISSTAFTGSVAGDDTSASIEIWLQPSDIWNSHTVLSIYRPGTPYQFSVRQSETDIELDAEIRNDPHPAKAIRLYVPNTFRKSARPFLTITTGTRGTSFYANGVLTRTVPQTRLPVEFPGRLVVGDAPTQSDSWSGEILGAAIYRAELTAAQVTSHYQTWTQAGHPEITAEERNLALYLFDEHQGSVVHDRASSGVNLYIPKKYMVLDPVFLEPFWREFSMSRSYWSSVVKNIVGFIPFGLCFYPLLLLRKIRRPALVTVLLGTLVSFTIEFLQAYLPTRDSGTSDLITNTLGTYMGVTAFRAIRPMLAARFLLDGDL
jgi:VanZ like protein/concanavalin A-like lectin/glucanase superfamily protein